MTDYIANIAKFRPNGGVSGLKVIRFTRPAFPYKLAADVKLDLASSAGRANQLIWYENRTGTGK